MPTIKLPTKKVIVFIVEGPSDRDALERIVKVIYRDDNEIVFQFTNGDITTDSTINKLNVEKKIYAIVDKVITEKKLKKSDICRIVHLFDMDGAYIPDSAIVSDPTLKIWYTPTQILCRNVDSIIERNAKKREMMDYLLELDNIKGIHYESYFMSSNLDHALYDKQNLPPEDKCDYADAFYERFKGNELTFIDFLETDVVNGCPDSMLGSWRYIKDGLHSLERHTNLNIFFKAQKMLAEHITETAT